MPVASLLPPPSRPRCRSEGATRRRARPSRRRGAAPSPHVRLRPPPRASAANGTEKKQEKHAACVAVAAAEPPALRGTTEAGACRGHLCVLTFRPKTNELKCCVCACVNWGQKPKQQISDFCMLSHLAVRRQLIISNCRQLVLSTLSPPCNCHKLGLIVNTFSVLNDLT